jgi:hypothetical protein
VAALPGTRRQVYQRRGASPTEWASPGQNRWKELAMKCRACWTDKAYLREDKSWKAQVFSFFGLLPVKCHHCFHKAWIPWFSTWGQQTKPPQMLESKIGKERMHEAVQPVRQAA